MPHVPEPFNPGTAARLSKSIDSLDRLVKQLRESVDRARQLADELTAGGKGRRNKSRRPTPKSR